MGARTKNGTYVVLESYRASVLPKKKNRFNSCKLKKQIFEKGSYSSKPPFSMFIFEGLFLDIHYILYKIYYIFISINYTSDGAGEEELILYPSHMLMEEILHQLGCIKPYK